MENKFTSLNNSKKMIIKGIISAIFGWLTNFEKQQFTRTEVILRKKKTQTVKMTEKMFRSADDSTIIISLPSKIAEKSISFKFEGNYLAEVKVLDSAGACIFNSTENTNTAKNLFGFSTNYYTAKLNSLLALIKNLSPTSKTDNKKAEVFQTQTETSPETSIEKNGYTRITDAETITNFLRLLCPDSINDLEITPSNDGYSITSKSTSFNITVTENSIIIPPNIKIIICEDDIEFEIVLFDDYVIKLEKMESGEEYILNIPDIYEDLVIMDQTEANNHRDYFVRKIKKYIATDQLHHLSKEIAINVISDYIKSQLFRDLAIQMIHAQFVKAYPNNALYLTSDYLEPNSIPDNSEYLLDALFMLSEKWKEACKSKLYDIYERLMKCGLRHFNMSRQENISNYFEAGMFGISLKVPNCSEYYEGKCYKVNIAPNLFDINFCNENNIGSNKVVRGLSVSYPFARLYIPLPGGNCIVSEDLGDGTYKIICVFSSAYEATLKHYVDVFSIGGEFYQIGGRRFNNKSDAVSYINGIWKNASQQQSEFFEKYYDQVLTGEQVDAIKEEYLQSGLNEKLCNSITSASAYPYRDLILTFPNIKNPISEVSIHLNHIKNSTRYKFEIIGSPNNLCDEDQSIYGEHISLFKEKFGKELTECEVDEIILKYITSDLFKKYVISFIKGMYEFRNAHTSPDDQIEYNEQDIERLLSTFVAMTSTWNSVFAESKNTSFYLRFQRIDREDN